MKQTMFNAKTGNFLRKIEPDCHKSASIFYFEAFFIIRPPLLFSKTKLYFLNILNFRDAALSL